MDNYNLFTVAESAGYLGIKKRRLYDLMYQKRIEYIKYLKFCYFTKEELERFQKENFKVVQRQENTLIEENAIPTKAEKVRAIEKTTKI